MPLYEYSCPRCGAKSEILARSAEAAPAPSCPACGTAMEKEWSVVAAQTREGGCSGGGHGGFR